jgi:hypothetical protein
MVQWLYTYVASVWFKYFSCFKRMSQVFYLDVAYVAFAIHICCKYMFQMFQPFQTYVASVLSGCCIYVAVAIHICCKHMFVNVSFVSEVCCSKCFMLQVLYDQSWEVGTDRGGPLVRAESERAQRPPHACVGACVAQQVTPAVPVGVAAAACGDNSSSSAWTGAPAAYQRAGRSCMHALWGPPKQSGRRSHGARVPLVGRMHRRKCVVCAVS